MNFPQTLTCSVLACLLAGCAMTKSIVHTPPGTSVELALAKKPEVVNLPATAATTTPVSGVHSNSTAANVPAVEPPMPAKDALTERVAEAYSRGVFCLQAEREEEALASFEEVVKIDPTFTDAWEKLATIYERRGDAQKALEAFKKAKTLARQ